MKTKIRNSLTVSTLVLWMFSSGNALATTDTWLANGDGTVSDVATGLIWQQQDDDVARIHSDAVTYCQNLTLANASNWRLPNIKELTSIIDFRASNPSIDFKAFPNTGNRYWSATNNPNSQNSAWFANFGSGPIISDDKTELFFVRCVR